MFGHYPHTVGFVCANFHISTIYFSGSVSFVPNLTFLGLLSLEISIGEKTVTQTDAHLSVSLIQIQQQILLF